VANGEPVTRTPPKPSAEPSGPRPVRTAEDLREKIEEVRIRVEKASKPTGPFGLFGLTTV
jgi:hypothetical protein